MNNMRSSVTGTLPAGADMVNLTNMDSSLVYNCIEVF